jgi:glutamate 5-kinase
MMSPDRQPTLEDAKRVGVKLGTAVLSADSGRLDEELLRSLASQIAELRRRGVEVMIVSSGAVAAGMAEMSLAERPKAVAEIQALAAIGQSQLMRRWHEAFAAHSVHVAQVLLSRSDLHERQRYLNARTALERLLRMGVVPIINENDTTAVDELRSTFGDNDLLASIVSSALDADLLLILTVADGLLGAQGEVVNHVERVDADVMAMVKRAKTGLGRGGMESKLLAAKAATSSGVGTIIANGKRPKVIDALFRGEPIGTLFGPAAQALQGRKRWIAHGVASGDHCVVVDAGAARALRENGKSLLPIGVREVRGDFGRDEVIEIVDEAGRGIGRGLVNHASDEVRRIMGLNSQEATEILGRGAEPTVIHRDNLIIHP